MFEIKPAYSESPCGDTLMVVDEGRDVWLQYIAGNGTEPGDYFKLVWKGWEIAFFVDSDNRWDEQGKEYTVKHISEFGGSPYVSNRKGQTIKIPAWHADSPEQEREAMLLATEALLAYGSVYNGHEYEDGSYRIEFEGRLYTKSDFGLL
ncbi:hypothetical protein [Brucella intermedia]|uniref:hypothetical protein n=1 Tax=Brucella intermedia TaxID=94625 RepID=UPI00046988E6|nr:hypothetical protein [Brucella intermedia]